MRVCQFCGQEIANKHPHTKTCGGAECKAQQKAMWQERKNKRKRVEKTEIHCSECGEYFKPHRRTQVVCSKYECRRSHRNKQGRSRAKSMEDKECVICGKQFPPKVGIQKACSEPCKKALRKQSWARWHGKNYAPAEPIYDKKPMDPLYDQGKLWCGVPVESTSFAPLR